MSPYTMTHGNIPALLDVMPRLCKLALPDIVFLPIPMMEGMVTGDLAPHLESNMSISFFRASECAMAMSEFIFCGRKVRASPELEAHNTRPGSGMRDNGNKAENAPNVGYL